MRTLRQEQVVFGVMLLLVFGTTAWFGLRFDRTETEPRRISTPVNLQDYVPQGAAESMPPRAGKWTQPTAQKRGKQWVYEIFTPPEILFDPTLQEFRTTGQAVTAAGLTAETADFGMVLLAVEPDEFPLQLVGYVGEPGHFLGTFENRVNYETLLLQTGDPVPALGLTVVDFRVERKAVEIPDSMTVNEYRATASVRSDADGEVVTLEQGVTRMSEGLRARVRLPGDDAHGRVMRTGETVEAGSHRYTLGKIRLAPSAVDVTRKQVETNVSEQQTLFLSSAPPPHAP